MVQNFEVGEHPKKGQFEVYLKNNENFFVNVEGEVWGWDQEINDYIGFKIFYQQQEVINSKIIENESGYWIWVAGLFVGIAVVVGLCFFYRGKKKGLEKKVYELTKIKAEGGEVFEENKADKFDRLSNEYKVFG